MLDNILFMPLEKEMCVSAFEALIPVAPFTNMV